MITIKLEEELGSYLGTKIIIQKVFAKIHPDTDKVVMDFNNIDIITRICAKEYLKQKNRINIPTVEINQSSEIVNVFNKL
ncbi:MAG: hypothetical protein Q4Q23_07765 [Methanobacteriaceae archaeon]|nr:hypothetical protein [Methanobacteriaceae archaeon]